MNQNAGNHSIMGNFADASLDYADGKVEFTSEGGAFFMAMFKGGQFIRRYKVTRTVGSRAFQMYIGTQTEGPEEKDDPIFRKAKPLLTTGFQIHNL